MIFIADWLFSVSQSLKKLYNIYWITVSVVHPKIVYWFSNSDRIKLAIFALKSGNDVESIAKILTWKDFEMFASEILNLSGYETECNLRFNKPRRIEIDVVGTKISLQTSHIN